MSMKLYDLTFVTILQMVETILFRGKDFAKSRDLCYLLFFLSKDVMYCVWTIAKYNMGNSGIWRYLLPLFSI